MAKQKTSHLSEESKRAVKEGEAIRKSLQSPQKRKSAKQEDDEASSSTTSSSTQRDNVQEDMNVDGLRKKDQGE